MSTSNTTFLISLDTFNCQVMKSTYVECRNFIHTFMNMVNDVREQNGQPPVDASTFDGALKAVHAKTPSQVNEHDCGAQVAAYARKILAMSCDGHAAVLNVLQTATASRKRPRLQDVFGITPNQPEDMVGTRHEIIESIIKEPLSKWSSSGDPGKLIRTFTSKNPKMPRSHLPVTERDVKSLFPPSGVDDDADTAWMTDQAMDAAILHAVSCSGHAEDVFACTVAFAEKCAAGSKWYNYILGLKRCLKANDMTPEAFLSKRVIVFPRNVGGTHWQLYILVNGRALLALLDGAHGAAETPEARKAKERSAEASRKEALEATRQKRKRTTRMGTASDDRMVAAQAAGSIDLTGSDDEGEE